jgi:hypothetical protein
VHGCGVRGRENGVREKKDDEVVYCGGRRQGEDELRRGDGLEVGLDWGSVSGEGAVLLNLDIAGKAGIPGRPATMQPNMVVVVFVWVVVGRCLCLLVNANSRAEASRSWKLPEQRHSASRVPNPAAT